MMKKSQILAAIALAMALGVVAPVSSASAKIVGSGATEAAADLTKAVAEAKKAGGEYKESTATDKTYYALLYGSLITAVNNIETSLKTNTETARGTLVTTIRTTVETAHTATNKQTTPPAYDIANEAERNALNAITATGLKADASFADVKAFAETLISKYTGIATKKNDDGALTYSAAAVKVAEDAVTSLNTAISTAQTTINGSYTTTATDTALKAMGVDTYDIMHAAGATDKTKTEALIAAAKAQPMYDSYKTLIELVDKAEDKVLKADSGVNFTAEEADAVRNAIVSATTAINKGETVKPVQTPNGTPADKDDVNAPATGIAGTAEGTATTVSIVAGLTTALTALGAGVVAYRSARRK